MKFKMQLSGAALSILAFSSAARADGPIIPNGEIVAVHVRDVFVPNGFDDNDEVVLVLDGALPDTCYRITSNVVNFDADTNTYSVTQYARRFTAFCLPDQVPFWTEVHLGQVKPGRFAVNSLGATENLAVKPSTTASPDDFLYAPVESAHAERDPQGTGYVAHIVGRFMNSCMQLDQIKVQDSGKTIEVLPIVSMAQTDECRPAEIPFDWTVRLPADLASGRHLLHVRSLNGKAINFMFSIADASPVRAAPRD